MSEIINRKLTITMNLTKLAKDFGYELETDSHDDVYHNGYSIKDIRSMDLRLSKDLEDVNKLFPSPVAIAMEDAERDAFAAAIRKERIEALKEALEKIDLTNGGAEYQDTDGEMISAKAGVLSVQVNEPEDTITIEILNPEHLINTIINGMGYIAPDLSSKETAETKEIESRIHNLDDYFDVFGESKPKGELSSQYSPSINDEYFYENIKERIKDLTLTEVAEAVVDKVESEESDPNETIQEAVKLVDYSVDEIKKEILSQKAQVLTNMSKELADWQKKLS